MTNENPLSPRKRGRPLGKLTFENYADPQRKSPRAHPSERVNTTSSSIVFRTLFQDQASTDTTASFAAPLNGLVNRGAHSDVAAMMDVDDPVENASIVKEPNTPSAFKKNVKLEKALQKADAALEIMAPEMKDLDLTWDQRRLVALNNLQKLLHEAKEDTESRGCIWLFYN
jgi:hypothetical protein